MGLTRIRIASSFQICIPEKFHFAVEVGIEGGSIISGIGIAIRTGFKELEEKREIFKFRVSSNSPGLP